MSTNPLEVDVVVRALIPHLVEDNYYDLLKYRTVCRIWNDEVVSKLKILGSAFQPPLPLGYGPETPTPTLHTDAQRFAEEVLENVLRRHSETASPRSLPFDTVLVDGDFYLASVQPQWTDFLEIHGHSIRHLKFKNRNNRVEGCDEIVSMENLRTAFCSTPYLDSLYLCIPFQNYESYFGLGGSFRLEKLTRLTIRQSYSSTYDYYLQFLRDFLSMTPNLAALHVRPLKELGTFMKAINALRTNIPLSLTHFGIKSAFVCFPLTMKFIHFQLTSLDLKDISGPVRNEWISQILQHHHSTLVKLTLGSKEKIKASEFGKHSWQSQTNPSIFPSLMKNLRTLEVNFSEFNFRGIGFYQIRFPVLENIALSGYIGGYQDILQFLPGEAGRSLSVQQFSLFHERVSIVGYEGRVRDTFPVADCHFKNSLSTKSPLVVNAVGPIRGVSINIDDDGPHQSDYESSPLLRSSEIETTELKCPTSLLIGILGICLTVISSFISAFVFQVDKCPIMIGITICFHLIFFLIFTDIILEYIYIDVCPVEVEWSSWETCIVVFMFTTFIATPITYCALCWLVFSVSQDVFQDDLCIKFQTPFNVLYVLLCVSSPIIILLILIAMIFCIRIFRENDSGSD